MFNYTIKGYKSFKGMEDEGFNLTLYRDGKKSAFVIYSGDGGAYQYDFVNHEEAECLSEFCKNHDPILIDGTTFIYDYDVAIWELLEKYDLEKQYKKLVKQGVCIRLKGDDKDTWRIFKGKVFTPEVDKFLIEKYGDTLEDVLNRRYPK